MKRVFAQTVVMVFVASCLAQEALGHAFLDKSSPAVGSTVKSAPTEVRITFTEDVQADKSDIQVADSSGKEIDKKDVHLDSNAKDKATLIVSLPALSAGTYKVSWHATCVFGHKTEGNFEFTVKGE